MKKILEFCNIPRTREEIAGLLKITTLSYAIKTYIQPMLDKNLLKQTIPNKPKSKNQKYVT